MPIGDISNKPQLQIVNPDGTKIMLGDIYITNAIVDSCHNSTMIDDDYYEVPRVSCDAQEYEFEVKWMPNVKALYFMFYGRFPANNWLRLHGYRAERKERSKSK